jgi:vitamin B12 transporter
VGKAAVFSAFPSVSQFQVAYAEGAWMSLTGRLLLLIHLLAATLLFADEHTFRLTGRVTDPSGAALTNASVRLYSRDAAGVYAAATDNHGEYSLTVPAGEYLVRAESAGLTLPKAQQPVTVTGAQTLPLQLALSDLSTSIGVTATGTAQSFDETAKALDIVDRAELDRRGVESLAEGLREVPGLRIVQRGGPGSYTTIQTRGLRTFDTAVLVDGMRFRDVAATQADASSFISDLLLVDTGRIEVLRGAGSSLYGTNAMGGVVNVVTDTGTGPLHGSVTADGGGLGQFRGLGRLGGGALDNHLHYSGGLGHQDVTRGVAGDGRYRNTTGNGLVDYSFRPGLVLSGRILATDVYGQLFNSPAAAPAGTLPAGRLTALPPPDDQLRLAGQGLPYALNGANFIPSVGDPDYSRTVRYVSTLLALQHQLSAPLSYRISYQSLVSDRNVVNGPLGTGFQPAFRSEDGFNGHIDTLQGRVNYLAGRHHLLSGGYEFEREYFDAPSSDNNPDPTQQVNSRAQVSEVSSSFDAQDQIRLFRDRLQISLSGRLQRFSLSQPQFTGTVPVYASVAAISPPDAHTGDVSVAWFVRTTGTKLRSHAGNSYRKPSLYELFGTSFSANSFSSYGDPRLKPERSLAIDGGLDQYFASDRLRLSVSYFYTGLQQVIAFDFSGLISPATDLFGRSSGYRNTGGGLARGAELSLEAKPWRSTRVQSSYTYTNARDKLSAFADGTLQTPRIAPHSFTLVVLQQWSKHVDGSLEFLAASDFLYPLSSRTFVFPGARQVAASLGYTRPLTERVTVRLYTRFNNLTDQRYYEDGFRTPGRWGTGGLTFSF